MKKSDYYINNDGNIVHTTSSKVRKQNLKQRFGFYHPIAVIILLALFFSLDLVMNVSLFDALLNDNVILRVLSVAAILTGLDIAPIYLGKELKKRNYYKKYHIDNKDSMFTIVLFFVMFLLAYISYATLRIITRDIVMPDLETVNSIMGTVQVDDNVNPMALPYAIVACVFPLITSFGSFAISYITSIDPIREKYAKIESDMNKLDDIINRYESIKKDYEMRENFKQELINGDNNNYANAIIKVKIRSVELADMVRREIAIKIQDPESVSILSQTVSDSFSHIGKSLDNMVSEYEKTQYLKPVNNTESYLTSSHTNSDYLPEKAQNDNVINPSKSESSSPQAKVTTSYNPEYDLESTSSTVYFNT